MKRILLISALILACVFFARSQPPSPSQPIPLHGRIFDSVTRVPLEDASISLYRMPGQRLTRSLRSAKNGFLIRQLQPGNYLLVASYLGYHTDTILLTIPDSAKTSPPTGIINLAIPLQRATQSLMQVVVTARIPPVILRNDTIAFNAGAYPTRPYATVEDLLKKLPGIQVDKNGNVTMQGQKVDKIYLDGKEFFLNDIRTGTQNLPADIVAQIEAFDTQSEQGRLTGIRDNTGGKTLNIKLKRDRKQGCFGQAYIGGGADGAYTGGGNATSLGAKRWLFAEGDANNINNQFTGKDNNGGPATAGIQSYTSANLNYRETWSKKIDATLEGGYTGNNNSLSQSNTRTTFLTDSSQQQSQGHNSSSKTNNEHLNASVNYRIDSFTSLLYHGAWTQQDGNSRTSDSTTIATIKPASKYLSSRGQDNNSNANKGFNLNNEVSFVHRFRKQGRSIYLGMTEAAQRQDQPATLYSRVDAFDSAGDPVQHTLIDQHSAQTTTGDGYGASLSYTEPLGRHRVLDIGYRINTNSTRSDKQSLDYDSATGHYDRPDTLTTGNFFSRNTIQRISAGYNITEGRINSQFGIALQFTDLSNKNYTTDTPVVQRFTNWYPRASIFYKLSKTSNLHLVYAGNSVAPTIDQLQPIPDLSNPWLVKLGNPALQQEFDHSLMTGFNSFNIHSLRNWQVSLQGNYAEHKISTATSILAGGVQQLQYINVEGDYHLSGNISYGFPLGDKKGNGGINLHGAYGHDITLLDGVRDIAATTSGGARLNLGYHPGPSLFIDANASLDYTGAVYSIGTTQGTRTWLQNYNLDLSYELPFSFTIATNGSLQVTGAQGSLPEQTVTLVNASISRRVLRNHSGQLRLSVFDLLDKASNYTQTLGPNYLETSRSNMPGRLFLLSFTWHFRQFPTSRP